MTTTPVALLKLAALVTSRVKTTFEPTTGVALSTALVSDKSIMAFGAVILAKGQSGYLAHKLLNAMVPLAALQFHRRLFSLFPSLFCLESIT